MFLTYSKIGNLQWDGKRREYQKKACFKIIPFLQFYIKEEEEEEEAFSMRKENELNCLINKIFLAPVSSTSVQEKSVACFMMWKKKKKERGSATFPAALFTVLRKKWERGSLERCFRAHRLFRENFQRNALNLLIRTEREREKKNEKIHVGVEFIG